MPVKVNFVTRTCMACGKAAVVDDIYVLTPTFPDIAVLVGTRSRCVGCARVVYHWNSFSMARGGKLIGKDKQGHEYELPASVMADIPDADIPHIQWSHGKKDSRATTNAEHLGLTVTGHIFKIYYDEHDGPWKLNVTLPGGQPYFHGGYRTAQAAMTDALRGLEIATVTTIVWKSPAERKR